MLVPLEAPSNVSPEVVDRARVPLVTRSLTGIGSLPVPPICKSEMGKAMFVVAENELLPPRVKAANALIGKDKLITAISRRITTSFFITEFSVANIRR